MQPLSVNASTTLMEKSEPLIKERDITKDPLYLL